MSDSVRPHGLQPTRLLRPWDIPGSLEFLMVRLHFHFSLSCIGEGNSNPLQCSCLENPRDEGAWWEAVYGFAQSQTQSRSSLKEISSAAAAAAKKL